MAGLCSVVPSRRCRHNPPSPAPHSGTFLLCNLHGSHGPRRVLNTQSGIQDAPDFSSDRYWEGEQGAGVLYSLCSPLSELSIWPAALGWPLEPLHCRDSWNWRVFRDRPAPSSLTNGETEKRIMRGQGLVQGTQQVRDGQGTSTQASQAPGLESCCVALASFSPPRHSPS